MIARSAFLPTSIEPISCPSPTAWAPSIVAISSAFSAVMIVGSSWTPLGTSAANFMHWKMLWLLLLAGPSEPSDTVRPAASISGTGAMPSPTYNMLHGLWETFTSRIFSSRRSRLLQCTQCTARTSGPRNPISSKNWVVVIPKESLARSTSKAFSDRCAVMNRPSSSASLRTAR